MSINALSQDNQKIIINAYKKFSEAPREIAYLHLNKSTFLKKETIGFSAYILNKNSKKPFLETSNLYCTILNEEDKVIKSKLVLVKNGLANNIFKIDSLFKPGIYKIRAYTNWMRNFNERNYYERPFYVIDPEIKEEIKKVSKEENYTIQTFPEGGHLVSDIKNNLGIIVKDNSGFGLANANGKIVDKNNKLITEFTLNQFGISKAPITPLFNETYKVLITYNNKTISSKIKNIENTGITISVSSLRNKVGISLNINKNTKEIVKNKEFLLAIHNGNQLKTSLLKFNDKTKVVKTIKNTDLFPGINIFTVFDVEKNSPILERLYFNSVGISKAKLNTLSTTIKKDSIEVKLQLKEAIDTAKVQNISVAALPSKTKSYSFNSNILSQTYLEPYVKGFIENAAYYFSNNSTKVKYNLDKLLITQGWSSYNWYNIFKKPKYPYKFEKGINIVANINGKIGEGFLIHPLKNNKTQIFNPSITEKKFMHKNLFPEDLENYKVSLIKKKGVTAKPNLYLQFYPTKVPDFTFTPYSIPFKQRKVFKYINNSNFIFNTNNGAEMLDEVVVKADLEKQRIEKIKNKSYGRVEFFNDRKTRGGKRLATYLSTRGFIARDLFGTLTIVNPRPDSPNNSEPLVILDGVQLGDFGFLSNFPMNIIDYIEIDKSGIGYGLRGSGGVIKIVTDPYKRMQEYSKDKHDLASYTFPISFNTPKQYYTPIYQDYNSKFFQEYGIVSWKPNLKFNKEGVATFKILNNNIRFVKFYIEGVVNSGTLISESKIINLLE